MIPLSAIQWSTCSIYLSLICAIPQCLNCSLYASISSENPELCSKPLNHSKSIYLKYFHAYFYFSYLLILKFKAGYHICLKYVIPQSFRNFSCIENSFMKFFQIRFKHTKINIKMQIAVLGDTECWWFMDIFSFSSIFTSLCLHFQIVCLFSLRI